MHKLKHLHIPEGARILRIDVKHFFMCGSSDVLARIAASKFQGRHRFLFFETLKWLLDNQYVVSDLLPGRLWQVVLGTGMGLQHSSAVADFVLYVLVDEWLLRPSTIRGLGILHYSRFRDDLLLVVGSRDHAYCLFRLVQARVREVYIIECPSISQSTGEMLPVNLQIIGNRVCTTPKLTD